MTADKFAKYTLHLQKQGMNVSGDIHALLFAFIQSPLYFKEFKMESLLSFRIP